MKKQLKHVFKKYKHKLLKKFIQSRFLKTKINFLFIMGITMIFQLHINIILCYVLMIEPYIDFFTQIIITIGIGFYTKHFLNFVLLFEKHIYAITRYFIHNYSFENYITWKRNGILFLSGYFVLILLFYELEKFKIILQIIQTIISFLILDQIQILTLQEEKKEQERKKIQTTMHIQENGCRVFTKIYEKGDISRSFLQRHS